MSKLRGAFIAQVDGGKSQNVGTGQSAPKGGNDLGSMASNQRQVLGRGPKAPMGTGQPSAPVKFRHAATGAGKPEK